MSDLSTYTKNAAIAGGGLNPVPTNGPMQYASRHQQYFDPETRAFTMLTAKYSSDFVDADVQGLQDDAPEAWETYRIRFADVVRPSSAIQRHFDDYKQFLFESYLIEYVRPGTKINTMGSTWLVINPQNISGSSGSGICRRCNAVWNYLDFYGNVASEPIIVENERANANDSDIQNSQLISKGYFNVICQYNDATRQIDTNTRMILGTGAYRVTGFSDFETEFTGDYTSVRLLSFTVRYEEPNTVIDDMENHVAGGKTFSWNVSVAGPSSLQIGAEAQFSAQSIRNGEILTQDSEYPISYLWESSDDNVSTVDETGDVKAVSEGNAVIRATLAQNTSWSAELQIEVTETSDGVKFTSTLPDTIFPYESATISAAYFEDGEETGDALTWTFSGAEGMYSAATSADGKSVEISGFGYSESALTVTVAHQSGSISAEIMLEGI